MASDLADLLEAYNSGSLSSIASFHGLARKGSKPKTQTIADLSRALLEPGRIQSNWKSLSAAERGLVEAILQLGGQASTRRLRDTLAKLGLIDPNARPEYPPRPVHVRGLNSRRFEDILARLTLRGLVFAAEDPIPPAQVSPNYSPPKRDLDRLPGTVFIPEPIRRHLPEPPPRVIPVIAAPAVATVQPSSARTFQRDLYLYWSTVRGEPFALTNKGEPPKPALKNINSRLLARAELGKGQGEQDHPRLRFIRLLLTAINLLGFSPDRQMVVTGQMDFFALPPAERVRRCFEAWRAGGFFNELLLLPPGVRPVRAGPALLTANPAAIRARQTVIDRLKDIAAAGWIALDTLLDELRDRDYEFLVRRPDPSSTDYYYRQPYDASINPFGLEFVGVHGDEDGWNKVEANFVRGVLHGPLHWMGLVDLGWTGEAQGPPPAFRLTALGQWLLAGGPRPDIPSEGGRVIVQPNLHIVALDPVADATLVQLDRFAERLSAERAVEYRLTRASVYAGQKAGWDGPRIKTFLREQTGVELAANVARTLDEWQAQHERIILRPSATFAHGPAELFDALESGAGRPEGGPSYVAGRPAPEVVRLAGDAAVAAFIEAAAAQGLLPLLTTGLAAVPNSVEAGETGQVRFLAARPNLYLHGHLAPLADPAGQDSYQISAASVARAVRAGFTAPEILQRLEAVNRGPLPAGLVRCIRAWAHHYGDAALEEVVLVQLRDPAAMEELMADPELAPLLRPFAPSAKKALARVRREDVELLRSRLAERGLQIESKLD